MGGPEGLGPGGFLPPVDEPPAAPAAPGPPRITLASWWARAGAALLDGLILLPLFFLGAAAGGVELFDPDDPFVDLGADALALQAWSALTFAVYHCVLLLRWEGQTVGKRVCGVRVVRADLSPLDLRTVLIRQGLIQGVVSSFIALFAIVDYLWPLFDKENRAVHDLAVDTRVVQA